MPTTVTLGINWRTRDTFENAGDQALIMSANDFKAQYLWGIPLIDRASGLEPDDNWFVQKILSAQKEVESYFNLKLFAQPITETKDFIREEFTHFGYVKTSYTINRVYTVKGRLNELQLISYPLDWLTIKRSNDDQPSRNLNIVPNGASTLTFTYYSVLYPGFMSFGGFSHIPNYWQLNYETGFKKIPRDLMEFIALLTTVRILPLVELSVLGGNAFGMASQNLNIDGLSQGGTKMNGGNIFQQRMKQTMEQIAATLPRLRSVYTGILFDVC